MSGFDSKRQAALDKLVELTEELRLYEEKPAQEPVATKNNEGITLHIGWDDLPVGAKLYTAPQSRPWVGLTEDEVAQAMYRADAIFTGPMQFKFAQEIEAKLKEKNT